MIQSQHREEALRAKQIVTPMSAHLTRAADPHWKPYAILTNLPVYKVIWYSVTSEENISLTFQGSS